MLRSLLILAMSFVLFAPPVASAEGALNVLKNRIIRALAVEPADPMHLLVGQKAKEPGTALVFQSLDGGQSWRTLNGNASLHPEATDVQAVFPVSKDILLAGTWKHGLYRSTDAGASFERVTDFPSRDIRDIVMADSTLYAATARDGVFESQDDGATWTAIGPGKDFFWSLTSSNNRLYASSPEGKVYVRSGDGDWEIAFDQEGANAAAATDGQLSAIAGKTGLHLSQTDGWNKILDGENIADVVITPSDHILAGTWKNGLAVVAPEGMLEDRVLSGTAVIHVVVAGETLYTGTWGKGLHILPMADVSGQ